MIQVIEGKVRMEYLPSTYTLKSGQTVTNYNQLDDDTLKKEGWLPVEDVQPDYNEGTERLIEGGYEILKDKAIKKYQIVKKTIEVSEQERLENHVLDLDYKIAMMEIGL